MHGADVSFSGTPIMKAMSLTERVQKEMVDAMRNKEELRLSTLRMMEGGAADEAYRKTRRPR